MESKNSKGFDKSNKKETEARTPVPFRVIRVLMFTFLLVGIVAFFVAQALLPKEKDEAGYFCEEFNQQWNQVHEDGTREPVEVPGRLQGEHGSVFRIETKVTARLALQGCFCLKASRQDVKVFVNNELRASYSTKETRLHGSSSASYYVFANFTTKDIGKLLTIEQQSDSPYSGIVGKMYYGTQAGIWMEIASYYGVELFLGLIMFLLALCCIIISIVLRFFYHRVYSDGDLLYLGCGVLLAGLWVIAQSPFRQLLFDNISATSDMTFFPLMLMPIPFCIYMDQAQAGRYRKIYRLISIVALVDTVACVILQLTDLLDYNFTIYAMFGVLGVAILTFVATMIIDIKKGRIGRYMQIAIGFGGVCIAGVVQITTYLSRTMQFGGTPMCFGFIFLLVMAVIRMLKNSIETENEKLEAQRASKMQEEFLANMSHEIRTPLNAIIGMNEMVLKETGEEHIRVYASDIKGASRTLLGLINDILDFSKIESGKAELTPVKYWTAFLLTDSYNLISKKAKEKEVEFKVEADPMVPEQLFGDEMRIRQVITNLLTNAVKYTIEGSITLKLNWRKTSIETAMLRISVADTGIGIKEEDQEKLFQSFSRVDEKRNRNIEGTGLGLVISKQLVELMGGRIWVKSVYGEGSEFFAEFPQKIVSERGMGEFSPHAMIDEEAMTAQSTVFTAPDARILVVDDVQTNLKVVKNLLRETQIKISTATSGQECLDMTKTTGYDLIFLDHRMPEMDGIETLHNMRARQDDPNEETPVIMLTANVVAGAKENYLREGFTDYLTKPIRQSDLKQMLIDYLPLHKVKRG